MTLTGAEKGQGGQGGGPGRVPASDLSSLPGISAPTSPPGLGALPGFGSSLGLQFLGGVNPIPFAAALVVMGVVMLSFPKAAVPLGLVIVLGALLADQKALAAFEVWRSTASRLKQ